MDRLALFPSSARLNPLVVACLVGLALAGCGQTTARGTAPAGSVSGSQSGSESVEKATPPEAEQAEVTKATPSPATSTTSALPDAGPRPPDAFAPMAPAPATTDHQRDSQRASERAEVRRVEEDQDRKLLAQEQEVRTQAEAKREAIEQDKRARLAPLLLQEVDIKNTADAAKEQATHAEDEKLENLLHQRLMVHVQAQQQLNAIDARYLPHTASSSQPDPGAHPIDQDATHGGATTPQAAPVISH